MQDAAYPATKRCSKCGVSKPAEQFNRNRNNRDGLHVWCKACNREYQRGGRPGTTCPECGGPKWYGARRCRKCKDGPPKTSGAGHQRAARLYKDLGTCEYEGCDAPAMDRHHKDGDGCNNAPSNIAFLCRRHHMTVDGRLERFIQNAPRDGFFKKGHPYYGRKPRG